jgi:hypothetical protein
VGMTAICAEGFVALLHGYTKASGDGFLAKRQVARALDQILQKQVISPLFAIADLDLQAIKLKPRLRADVIISGGFGYSHDHTVPKNCTAGFSKFIKMRIFDNFDNGGLDRMTSKAAGRILPRWPNCWETVP